MRLFHCTGCGQLVFFENTACLRCGRELAFDPVTCVMLSAPGSSEPGALGSSMNNSTGLRHCRGGAPDCNWLAGDGPDERCVSCRLTTSPAPAIDSISSTRWQRLESAKRRLLYTLLRLGLPLADLRFSFPEKGLTGHADGLITIVLSEADDAERERRRVELHEPLRTLLGHMRHEIGHFYHAKLVLDSPLLPEVRAVFGDERADYQAALKRHYAEGPPAGWEQNFISAYATSHPHEDWAETWAHYLHIVDGVEISEAYGLRSAPITCGPDGNTPAGSATGLSGAPQQVDDFAGLLAAWLPLTYLANSLNRSIGLNDWYPFVMNPPVIERLRLIHRVVVAAHSPAPVVPAPQATPTAA